MIYGKYPPVSSNMTMKNILLIGGSLIETPSSGGFPIATFDGGSGWEIPGGNGGFGKF